MSLTLDALLILADERLGGRKHVMNVLQVSRQRLYSAAHGGPALRAERLVQLALVTGVAPGDALHAGGQHKLADLLDQALEDHLPEATTPQRVALRHLGNVAAALERAIGDLQHSLGASPDSSSEASS